MANGVEARVHGNKGRTLNKNWMTLTQVQNVVQFIMNCTCVEREGERVRLCKVLVYVLCHVYYVVIDVNAMLLPGRVPAYKDSDVKLLPSNTSKHAIWELYLDTAAANSIRVVAYSTFTWRQLLPNGSDEANE